MAEERSMKTLKGLMFLVVMTAVLSGCATPNGYRGDPRGSIQGYTNAAIVGGISGLLIGDSGRAAGIGAGAMMALNGVTQNTQSISRVARGGGGQQYQGRPQYRDDRYYDDNGDYYDDGYRCRETRNFDCQEVAPGYYRPKYDPWRPEARYYRD